MAKLRYQINKEARPVYPEYKVGDTIKTPFNNPKIGLEVLDVRVLPLQKLDPITTGYGAAFCVEIDTVTSIEEHVNSRTKAHCAKNKLVLNTQQEHELGERAGALFAGFNPNEHFDASGYGYAYRYCDDKYHPGNTIAVLRHVFNGLYIDTGSRATTKSLGMLLRDARLCFVSHDTIRVVFKFATLEDLQSFTRPGVRTLPRLEVAAGHCDRSWHSYKFEAGRNYTKINTFERAMKEIQVAAQCMGQMKLLRNDTKKDIGAKRRNIAAIEAINQFMELIEIGDTDALAELKANPTVVYNAILPWINRCGGDFGCLSPDKHHYNTSFYMYRWNGAALLQNELGLVETKVTHITPP